MRALVWDGHRAKVVDDMPPPQPTGDDAIVRVRRAGICSTDLEILAGYLGFRGVPGHEFVGDVEIGPNDLRGQRVVGEINVACRRCPTCDAGRPRHCPARSVIGIVGADGAFAELVRVPRANLHRVPSTVSDEAAVFVEPLAAAFEAAAQTTGFQGGKTLVLGAGKLGLLVAQVLEARGDQVSVLVRRPEAARTVESLNLCAVGSDPTPGSWDLVVDATGSPAGLAQALAAVRPLGAVVLKTTQSAPYSVDLAPLVINEVTVIGSRCGSFSPALEALASGSISVGPLLQETVALSRAEDALRRAAAPGALKVLIDPAS